MLLESAVEYLLNRSDSGGIYSWTTEASKYAPETAAERNTLYQRFTRIRRFLNKTQPHWMDSRKHFFLRRLTNVCRQSDCVKLCSDFPTNPHLWSCNECCSFCTNLSRCPLSVLRKANPTIGGAHQKTSCNQCRQSESRFGYEGIPGTMPQVPQGRSLRAGGHNRFSGKAA